MNGIPMVKVKDMVDEAVDDKLKGVEDKLESLKGTVDDRLKAVEGRFESLKLYLDGRD